jgi:hypothetical protein
VQHVPDPQISDFVSTLTEDMACELADQMGDLGDAFMLAYTRLSGPRLFELLRGVWMGIVPGAGTSRRAS